MIPNEKKVMIILWKWQWKWKEKDFEGVSENTFTGKEMQAFINNIEKGKGHFYNEYAVEYSDLCPDALLVAANIYKEVPELLYALIDHYAVKGNQVMLFLHRGHAYNEEQVEAILKKYDSRVKKCFLIADKRDYIYYHTQNSGFLDDTGRFFIGRNPHNDDEKIITFENGVVKQPYYDRVWQYYENEFESKVFQFKEELFDIWMRHTIPGQPEIIPRKHLIEDLENAKNREMYFRLKSFLGAYQSIKDLDAEKDFDLKTALEKEQKTIGYLEKMDKASYVFDDCIVNLEHLDRDKLGLVSKAYEDCKSSLHNLLFTDSEKTVDKSNLRALADKFAYLVKVIPGVMD